MSVYVNFELHVCVLEIAAPYGVFVIMEQLQLQVEARLFDQDEGRLVEMIEILGVEDDVTSKTKMQKIKIIRKEIDSKMEGDETVARKCLEQLLAYIEGTVPPLEETKTTDPKPAAAGVKSEQADVGETVKKGQVEQGAEDILAQLAKTKAVPSLLRREYKLSGQIGEPGQTEKLTFVSLMHQIDSGLKRGYKESEIVDAVIRAISPHSSLRSYVETLSDLSLAKLRRILRVHYREKAASEVYQQLATVCQQSNESPQQFLLRALDLRNKVNFASQESDSEFNYGPTLIQKTFVKSFETGLRDDILASNLRAALRTPGLTDEELMKQVNELASQQDERNTKLATESQKKTRVNACEVPKEGEQRTKNTGADGSQQILLEIRQMKSEINDLKGRVNAQGGRAAKPNWSRSPYRGRGDTNLPKYPGWGCQSCKERGRGEECGHCFACGNPGHVARDCTASRRRSGRQGNDQRLFRRDTE